MAQGLSDFIAANAERIVDECEAFARTLGPAADDMDSEALRDHLEEILDGIAANMRLPQTEWQRAEKSMGRAPLLIGDLDAASQTHGTLRAASGFDITQTASEYRALRASVIRLWLETRPQLGPSQVEELTRFNEAVDQALAETLLQFAAAVTHGRNLFLGVLSHELRTPLGTIAGSAQTLAQLTQRSPATSEASNRILRGSQRIRSILDDLLDYVHGNSTGGIRVTPVDAGMDEICARIVGEVESAFPGCRIELGCDGDARGCWDPQRIGQAVSNLISNALKYGDPAQPVRVKVDGTDVLEICVTVHNAGPAIPPEMLESLFQPLVRGRHGDPTGYSLGLGLFIVREIATAHAGTVDVRSVESGTTFRLRLPRSADGTQPSAVGRMRRT